MATPEECMNCQRPMRPVRTRIADWPGTVPHAAGGLCLTCYTKAKRTTMPVRRVRHYVSLTSIPEITAEQRSLILRQIARMAPDPDVAMGLAGMLLGSVRS